MIMKNDHGPPDFPYHYGTEADTYTFYRIPKILFQEACFSALSTDAKLLYGLLIDRMQLSQRNGWVDEYGRVYIYFKVETVMEALACGNKKAGSLLAELDDKKGIGLISRVRQGMGKPDRIYVRKCITQDMSKEHFKTCQNDISDDVEMTSHDMSKGHPNKNEKKEIEINNTDLIESDPVEDRMRCREEIEKYLDLDALRHDLPYQQDDIREIVELMVDILCSGQRYIRISGDDLPMEVVKERLRSLTGEHIRYVIGSMGQTTSKVRNIRKYLLAALYNAPVTISSYYGALVRHDMNSEAKGGSR